MIIRTREELNDKLDDELAWRKKELTAFYRAVDSASHRRESALLRGGIAILYAHWEGFVKAAGTLYLTYVADIGLRYRELAPHFFGLAVRSRLDEMRESSRASTYTAVCKVFFDQIDHRAKLPRSEDVIDTGSNLKPDVFRNIVDLLGLDYSQFATKEKPVVEELLKLRNRIAHGKWVLIDFGTYAMLHGEIIGLLGLFRDQIDIATDLKTYRRI